MTPGRRERRERREREIFLCYHWWLCLYSRARCERYKTSRADAPKVGDGWRRDQWNMSRWNINSRLSACSCLHSLARTLCFFFFFPPFTVKWGLQPSAEQTELSGAITLNRWTMVKWKRGRLGWLGTEKIIHAKTIKPQIEYPAKSVLE